MLFWAVWLTLVTAINLFDAMTRLDVLPEGSTLAPDNFSRIAEAVGTHGIPTFIAALLFACVIVWEGAASVLLWRAWVVMRRGERGTADEVTQAFAVSLALWVAFLVATEATVSYATAGTHKSALTAQLLGLLVHRVASMSEPPTTSQ